MITLLSSLLVGTSLLNMACAWSASGSSSGNTRQGCEQQQTPLLPGANQHVRHWPGISGDGRTPARSTSTGRAKSLVAGAGIPPVSTVTLLQGWTVQGYTDAQWQSLFKSLASQGTTCVVFATSVDETEGTGQFPGTPSAYPAGIATAWYPVSSTVTANFPNVAYPGNASGASRSPVAECLYYAQHNGVNNGMSVYLGLNFYADEWGYRSGNVSGSGYIDPITDSNFCASEANLGALVAADLSNQFGNYPSFAGWYWPWEVDNNYFDKNIGSGDYSFLPNGYATSAYNNLISMLETSYYPLSGKPRLISPFFNPYYENTANELPYTAYTASEYGALWQEIFATIYEGSPLFTSTDIFAPQDGAGDYQPQLSGNSSLQGPPSVATITSVINAWYPPLLQAASSISGMEVWANADTYQVDVEAYGAPSVYVENDATYAGSQWVDGAFVSAGMSRIAAQFQAEATVNYSGTYRVSKIMNCSNAYYDDPLAVWSNAGWSAAWGTWQTSQFLGSPGVPSAPSVGGPASSSGHCRLTLTVPASPNGVCGFDIWRDGYTAGSTPYVLSEIPLSAGSSTAFLDPDSNSYAVTHTYYVAAYDVYGNLSAVTQLTHNATANHLTLSPSTVTGGATSLGTISLGSPAPSGGMVVSLASNSINVTVPPTAFVAAGSTKVTFTVATTGVGAVTSASISASIGGTPVSAVLSVNADTVASVTVSPATIYGGSTATGTVTLGAAAGPSGVAVSLSSSVASATVPATVTVAPGATSASFTVATTGVAAFTTVGIAAAIGSSSQTDYVGVVPAGVLSVSLSTSSVVGGASATATVTLNGLAGPGGEVVVLSCNSGFVGVPSAITVPAGAKSATFTITTKSVTTPATATVTAGADYVYAAAALTIRSH